MSRAVPTDLNYQAQTPLAVPSSSNRRTFGPTNGATFKYDTAPTIRVEINSQNGDFLDAQHSYLEVSLRNDHVAADELCLGLGGMSWCDSMRVTQGSVTLEHIRNYGELHAMLQMCQQSPDKIGCDDSLMGGGPGLVGEVLQDTAAGADYQFTRRVSKDVHYNAPLLDARTPYSGGTNIVPGQTSIRLAVPLISSILGNSEKYIPLGLLGAAPIVLELGLARPSRTGVWATTGRTGATGGTAPVTVPPVTAAAAAGIPAGAAYTVTNVRYVAHMVSLDRSFTDLLARTVQEVGSITLHGQGWTSVENTFLNSEGSPVLNLPVRKKSVTAAYTIMKWQADGAAQQYVNAKMMCGVGKQMGCTSYQYQIGSVQYPQSAVEVSSAGTPQPGDARGCAAPYAELAKSFGRLGVTTAETSLSRVTFGLTNSATNPEIGAPVQMCPFSYGFSSFGNKNPIEDGIDLASTAAPFSIHLERTAAANGNPIIATTFVAYDHFFHIDASGLITPSD
jgi:hypothetical protein